MFDVILIPIALIYLIVVSSLFVYGVNFFYMAYLTWRKRGEGPTASPPGTWPQVTVQIPIYNEMYVAERVICAAAQLDYPGDLLEIQVLDDSTDETVQIVRSLVERLQARGVDIVHLHRQDRRGYKAGALALGTQRAKGEFLAIFDADFLPQPEFLKQTVPYFQDREIGFVQARWGHVNSKFSLITQLQSLAIDAHFMVEQFARSRGGYWFNFNGTAGVWRKATIIDAGGWKSETLTEDLDLSYRAFLRGWRAHYVRDVEVPAELPVSFSAYRQQQHRWACGSLECARNLLPAVWNSSIPLSTKLAATLHLTGYSVHLLLFALVLLYPIVVLLSQQYPALISLFGIAFIFNATALAPTTFFIVAQKQLGWHWWQKLPGILFITAFGSGMMVNTLRAAVQAFSNREGVFKRTPKFGIVHKGQKWVGQRYQLKFDPIVALEFALALFNLGTVILAIRANNWVIALYASIFCIGLFFTSGLSVFQAVAILRGNRQLSRQNIKEPKGLSTPP